ncbi:MAG: hypothetical protein JXA41_11550 [Deltaproteobacteria bacterium]|nr:hypothetical protein [Deltaproteobacteria bacterium]
MGMQDAINELYERREKARQMGGKKQVDMQHARGRMTARERINYLLDPDSFWEIGLLNRSDLPEMYEKTAADGRICGVGKIHDRRVAVVTEDRTILGGSGGRVGNEKTRDMHVMAVKGGYPIISLGDELGGIRLPDHMGSDGMSQARPRQELLLTPRQTPRIAAIMGECFGAPSWIASQSDFVVMVKGTAMGAAGPRILKMAIGQDITPQELAGWELRFHETGEVDAIAENDEECLNIIREYLTYMPQNNSMEPPALPVIDDPYRRIENVDKLVPDALNRGYDMHRLIKAIVDDGRYFPIKDGFGKSLITCLARIAGRVVGVIANNPMYNAGAPDVSACEKVTSFICLCDSFNIPLIFLSDIPGLFPGQESERQKLPGKIMVWHEARALASVPKISITIRKGYGMGWNCMLSPGEGGDFVVAWPTASISFVDSEIGIEIVHGAKISQAKDAEAEKERLRKEWAISSAPWAAAERNFLQDVIDPRETRKFLAEALDIIRGERGSIISEHKLQTWPTVF